MHGLLLLLLLLLVPLVGQASFCQLGSAALGLLAVVRHLHLTS